MKTENQQAFDLVKFLANSTRCKFWMQKDKENDLFAEMTPEITDGKQLFTEDEAAQLTESAGFQRCFFFVPVSSRKEVWGNE